ncbi:MAG: hypothetical protein ISS33_02540 [Candidatus Omnitrophica bacterium]|nr:hypothetical protein [Candidatus Omnitrophota bacterium]
MDKKQYKLLSEILKRFQAKGILKSIILIGSWCIPLYKEYFKELKNVSALRTRDMDFLVPLDAKFKTSVDVVALLKDLDFKEKFVGQEGYIRLVHVYLTLEFLVPEKGRGSDKPHKLPKLGLNAQRLRFLDMLTEETIQVEFEGTKVIIPHPVNFALHKLLICTRRSGSNKKEKSEKDKRVAIQILDSLIKAKRIAPIRGIFSSLHKNRKKEILKTLKSEDAVEILGILEKII